MAKEKKIKGLLEVSHTGSITALVKAIKDAKEFDADAMVYLSEHLHVVKPAPNEKKVVEAKEKTPSPSEPPKAEANNDEPIQVDETPKEGARMLSGFVVVDLRPVPVVRDTSYDFAAFISGNSELGYLGYGDTPEFARDAALAHCKHDGIPLPMPDPEDGIDGDGGMYEPEPDLSNDQGDDIAYDAEPVNENGVELSRLNPAQMSDDEKQALEDYYAEKNATGEKSFIGEFIEEIEEELENETA